jgi:hypothetical protein
MKVTIDGVEITLTEEQKKQICEQMNPKEFWGPKEGERAYYVTTTGIVLLSTLWNSEEGRVLIARGRVFKTREEAELFSQREKARYALKKRIWELNGGEFPKWDWMYASDIKYYAMLDAKKNLGVYLIRTIKAHPSWFYLKTPGAVHQLIEEMPNELRLVLGE